MTTFNDETTVTIAEAVELPDDKGIPMRWGTSNKIRWEVTHLVEDVDEIIGDLVNGISVEVKLRRAQELLALRSRPV